MRRTEQLETKQENYGRVIMARFGHCAESSGLLASALSREMSTKKAAELFARRPIFFLAKWT
jgi:hypothetical protein